MKCEQSYALRLVGTRVTVISFKILSLNSPDHERWFIRTPGLNSSKLPSERNQPQGCLMCKCNSKHAKRQSSYQFPEMSRALFKERKIYKPLFFNQQVKYKFKDDLKRCQHGYNFRYSLRISTYRQPTFRSVCFLEARP